MSGVNIEALLKSSTSALQAISDSPRLEAELLLAQVLKKPKSYLYSWPEKIVSTAQLTEFNDYIARRTQGEPIAYIIGEKEFWSLNFSVNPAVLIPRADTEILVETILALLPTTACTIADLGTGSGAIAVSLAHERREWEVWATDLSLPALDMARANAAHHQVNIEFRQGHWCEALPAKKFHAIVSNPPYIAANDPHLLTDIRYEPKGALVAEQEGLEDLALIIHHATRYLLPGGYLALEHGYNQADAVAALCHKAGYTHIRHATDLSGHRRLTYAKWL